jgi:cell division GTPase FtsZ
MKQTIHLNENDLKNLIRETISEMGEVMDDEGYAEAIDFDTMQNIFKQFGISTIGSREVENPQTGETGIRYEIDGENINKEELENALKSAANNPDGIIVSLGRHRNAPEITRWSVVVLDY